jgi:hypothetical protein
MIVTAEHARSDRGYGRSKSAAQLQSSISSGELGDGAEKLTTKPSMYKAVGSESDLDALLSSDLEENGLDVSVGPCVFTCVLGLKVGLAVGVEIIRVFLDVGRVGVELEDAFLYKALEVHALVAASQHLKQAPHAEMSAAPPADRRLYAGGDLNDRHDSKEIGNARPVRVAFAALPSQCVVATRGLSMLLYFVSDPDATVAHEARSKMRFQCTPMLMKFAKTLQHAIPLALHSCAHQHPVSEQLSHERLRTAPESDESVRAPSLGVFGENFEQNFEIDIAADADSIVISVAGRIPEAELSHQSDSSEDEANARSWGCSVSELTDQELVINAAEIEGARFNLAAVLPSSFVKPSQSQGAASASFCGVYTDHS